jgi:hypothetical protein
VLWSINHELAARFDGGVLVHAGAVARNGEALAIAGASGAGKSTLVLALALSGWSYLTDEAVPLAGDEHVEPYRRPITLKPGSWPLFPELEPTPPVVHPPFTDSRWHLPPHVFDRSGHAPGGKLRWLVFPERIAGSPVSIEPLTPGRALTELLRHCLNPAVIDARTLLRAARAVEGTEAVRLTYDAVEDAVDAIDRLSR